MQLENSRRRKRNDLKENEKEKLQKWLKKNQMWNFYEQKKVARRLLNARSYLKKKEEMTQDKGEEDAEAEDRKYFE